MRSIAAALLFAVTVSVSVYGKKDPLPAALLEAKTVYVEMGSFVPTKKNDDQGAEASYLDPCKKVLEKWGRIKIVDDPKQADIILRISSQRSTDSVFVSTSSASGSVGMSEVLTVVSVVQASSGKQLWTGAGQWAANWTAKIITKSIVNSLRIDVEKQAKDNGDSAHGGTISNLNPTAGPLLAENTSHGRTGTSAEEHVTPMECVVFDKITSQFAPPDLYKMVAQRIQNSDYPSALALFVLAGMDTRFDISRVADRTVGDTGTVLMMNAFADMPEAAKNKFNNAIKSVSADNVVRDYVCGWAQQIGPPTYYPRYMIMHGMNAVTAGLTQTPLQQQLVPLPDVSGTWKKIGTNYLHCAPAQKTISWDAPDADRYRKAVERAVADISVRPAPGTATSVSSSLSSTNKNGATSDQPASVYGPLTFNSDGADFYIAQDGRLAPASVFNGAIEIHLHPSGFQIGYNGEQMNVCLAQTPFPEIRPDPSGYKASCLSGPLTGARDPNSDALLVYGGHKWSDGNTELSDATSRKAAPMKGFRLAYEINQLLFVDAREMTLSHFRGTLYGYIVVYKQHERSNKNVMPIHLIFE